MLQAGFDIANQKAASLKTINGSLLLQRDADQHDIQMLNQKVQACKLEKREKRKR